MATKTRNATAGTKSGASSSKPIDAITLLKQDHRKVEKLFAEFDKAKGAGPRSKISRQVCVELTVHASIEEKSFYPEVRSAKSLEDIVLESLEEHRQVKQLVGEIESLQPDDERLEAKMKVLEEDVKHHVEEEETEMFPKVQRELGKERLQGIGARLKQDKMSLLGQVGRGEAPTERRMRQEVEEPKRPAQR